MEERTKLEAALDELLAGKSPEEIAVPRDRNGRFEPQILPKHERRFTGFDDKIISMYARGMSTRDIQAHLQEIYGVEVSPGLVSEVTEAVMEDVRAWQSRPLEPLYMILYLDALMVKMRHEGRVENRAVFVSGQTLLIANTTRRRDFHRQSGRNPARCQRMKVVGLTIARASRQSNRRDSQTKASLVHGFMLIIALRRTKIFAEHRGLCSVALPG